MSLSKLERRILEFLQENSDTSYKTEQIAQHFNYKGSKNYKKLIKALAFLERINEIQVSENGRFKAIGKVQSKVVGEYRSNDRGFGFVDYDEDEPDLFIPPGRQGAAMDGDIVEVSIIKHVDPSTGKGSEAHVERIVERSASQLVGEFFAFNAEEREEQGYLGYVKPQGDYNPATTIMILEGGGVHPVNHSIVIVKIVEYPSKEQPELLTGLVAKEIGHKDAPGVDILSILYQFNIPHEFPEAVLEEAEAVKQVIDSNEIDGRRDLRDELIITIDGADAKDLDDAISLKKLSQDEYQLGVHIADVSHYVKENSPIDVEAFSRGTSVYLTDRVVPMLPQRLSNGICSLHPNEDRLTVTCQMNINNQGKVTKSELFLSVINSSYRMTYTDVNAILAGDETLKDEYSDLVPMLEEMEELHVILEKMRLNRGALNFETKEAKFIVDEEGHPLDIVARERGVGERIIESFMLAANETVALTYREKEWPMIYRIHEQPDEDRIQKFAEFITSFGVILRGSAENIRPKQLQEVLFNFVDTPYQDIISMMTLRSMQQARYSEEPTGHYGLAARDYTHFTSPIRRYPDLIVHRLLHLYLQGKPSNNTMTKLADRIPEIAEHSSKMERRSVEAERETDALKKAEFMLDKVGEQFEGVISSITSFGMFVQLPTTVEGLISLPDLKDDYYRYIPEHIILVGERTNNIYRIGQRVLIEVAQVSVEDREIDFTLVEAYPTDNTDLEHLQVGTSNDKQKRQQKTRGSSKHGSDSQTEAQRQQSRKKRERKNKGKKQFKIKRRK